MASLTRAFFERDTVEVARDLLGCILVHRVDDGRVAARIVETEAYHGWDDKASHAHRGRTPRNSVMFGMAGVSYVYLCYGVHWMLNVVARPPDAEYGAAVLIRAVEPLEGLEYMAQRRAGLPRQQWTNGPGRLTRAMGIVQAHNGMDLLAPDSALGLEVGERIPEGRVVRGPRVGINVPEPWKSVPWRFWVADSLYISRRSGGS
ncbi:MAG: DNA-3-methyladenine glycosylase [Anaerolineae bacterium]